MKELDLYTSEELVQELTNRNTFAGLIIRSANEVKSIPIAHNNWCLSYSNLSLEQVHILLDDINSQIVEELDGI